ncbi:hypothetical protein DCC62_01840 [candidate division KSB1 bacterium]|nr:MAG: hypothetical protein DCC62_01840 [candidate division KSB1 bacterium]
MKTFISIKLFPAATMLLVILSVNGYAQSPGLWETNGPRAALPVRINSFARLQTAASDTIFAASSEGVLFSQDAGLTWQKLLSIGNRIALLFNVQDTLYALRDGLPYKSIDAGATWPSLSFAGLGAVKDNLFSHANGTLLVVTQQNSIYFSRNGGRNWQQAILPGNGMVINSFMAGDSLFFAGTDAHGLLMSSDSGATWETVNSPLNEGRVRTVFFHDGQLYVEKILQSLELFYGQEGARDWRTFGEAFRIYGVTFMKFIAGRFYVGNNFSIWHSSDAAGAWQMGTGAIVNQFARSLISTGNALYAGTNLSGVYTSTDGGALWQKAETPFRAATSLDFLQQEDFSLIGTESAIFRSRDSGETWARRSFFDPDFTFNAPKLFVGQDVLAAFGQDGLFLSYDAGSNWLQIQSPVFDNNVVRDFISIEGAFVAATLRGIFYSFDLGATWTEPVFNTEITSGGKEAFTLLTAGNAVYAGLRAGIFRSVNGGLAWRFDGESTAAESFLAAGNRLFARGGGSIFRRVPGELRWQRLQISGNPQIAALLYHNGVLYAGARNSGIYMSEDDGGNWQAAQLPPNLIEIESLFAADSTNLFAGAIASSTTFPILISRDRGRNWEYAQAPLNLGRLAKIEASGQAWYAVAGGSIHRSLNRGQTWTPLQTGLENALATVQFERLATLDRLLAFTAKGYFLQREDLDPPQPKIFSIQSVDNGRFTKSHQIDLIITAEGADFMRLSEDASFANAPWVDFNSEYEFPLSAGDGEKMIYAQFRDFSWNLSDTISASITLDTQTPRFAEHLSPQNARPGNEITVTQQILDDNPQSAELFFRRAGETWNPNIRRVLFDGDAAAIADVWVNNRGLDYQISASDLAGNESTLQNGALDFYSLPVNIAATELGNSRSLPGGTGGAAYRIVSIPLDLQDSPQAKNVFENLGKYGRRGNWRFYAYSGNSQWEEGENIQMQTGAGYFMIRRSGGSLTNAISAATTKTTDGVLGNISGWQLRGGDWTLIGNPYNTRIELSQLKLKREGTLLSNHGAEVQVWNYDGQWRNPIIEPELALEAWGGLFIRASEADTIVFANDKEPYARNAAKTGIAATELAEGEWSIQITAASGEFSDVVNYFGVRKEAKDDLDNFDWHEPPFLPDGIGLSFPHPGWNSPAELTADFRGNESDGQRWEISVKGEPSHAVQLGFANIESAPNALQILLVDEITKIVHDLRKEATVAVRIPEAGVKSLAILVGDDFFINKNTAGMLAVPTTFALHQNYPNPFNPSTTIRYQMPVAGRVTLKIFDMLGREVLVLEENKSREPGYYEAVADMNALGSGVYFYQIAVAGEQKFLATKKMLYVK